jgi:hypothetical protein
MEFVMPPPSTVPIMGYGGQDPSSGAQISDFARWRAAVSEAADRVGNVASDLLQLGNELFGVVPEAVPPKDDRSEPQHCQAAALEAQLDRLLLCVSNLEDRFRRLRRLA